MENILEEIEQVMEPLNNMSQSNSYSDVAEFDNLKTKTRNDLLDLQERINDSIYDLKSEKTQRMITIGIKNRLGQSLDEDLNIDVIDEQINKLTDALRMIEGYLNVIEHISDIPKPEVSVDQEPETFESEMATHEISNDQELETLESEIDSPEFNDQESEIPVIDEVNVSEIPIYEGLRMPIIEQTNLFNISEMLNKIANDNMEIPLTSEESKEKSDEEKNEASEFEKSKAEEETTLNKKPLFEVNIDYTKDSEPIDDVRNSFLNIIPRDLVSKNDDIILNTEVTDQGVIANNISQLCTQIYSDIIAGIEKLNKIRLDEKKENPSAKYLSTKSGDDIKYYYQKGTDDFAELPYGEYINVDEVLDALQKYYEKNRNTVYFVKEKNKQFSISVTKLKKMEKLLKRCNMIDLIKREKITEGNLVAVYGKKAFSKYFDIKIEDEIKTSVKEGYYVNSVDLIAMLSRLLKSEYKQLEWLKNAVKTNKDEENENETEETIKHNK